MPHASLLCALLLLSNHADWFPADVGKAKKLAGGTAAEVKEALGLLDGIEQEAAKREDKDWQLYAQWQRGCCEARLGNRTRAQKILAAAIKAAGDDYGPLVFMHKDLGEIYLRSWKMTDAERSLDAALARAKQPIVFRGKDQGVLPEPDRLRLRFLKAQCLLYRGENKAARKEVAGLEADVVARRSKAQDAGQEKTAQQWTSLLVQCRVLLAQLERRDGNAVGGLLLLKHCVDELRSLGEGPVRTEMECSCRLDLAMCYWKLARFDDARDQLAQTETLLRALPSDQFSSELANARASLQIEEILFSFETDRGGGKVLERLDTAEAAARSALDLSRKVNPEPNTFSSMYLSNLAQVHELRGRVRAFEGKRDDSVREYERALALGEESLKTLKQLDATAKQSSHDLVLEVRRFHAQVESRLGHLEAARKEATEARDLFSAGHGKDDVGCGLFHQLLVEIEDAAGNRAEAAVHARAQRRLAAERLVAYLAPLTAPEQIRFFRQWDDPGLHASLRLGLHDKSLRGPSAEWLINGKAKIAEVMAAINRHERSSKDYRAFHQAVERQAYFLYAPPDVALKMRQTELLRQEEAKRELAAGRTVPEADPPLTLAQARKGLADDEIFIDIFCLRPEENAARAYYAWVMTAQGEVAVVPLGDADRIDGLVKEFIQYQEHVTDAKGPLRTLGGKEAERRLQRDLLQPLSDLILKPLLPLAAGKTRWIVSPDGPLWNVPWAALLLPNGKYAVEEIAFRHVISGRDLKKSAAPAGELGAPFVLANPDLDHPPAPTGWHRRPARDFLLLPDLPSAAEEGREVVAALKDYFPGEPRLQDGTATKAALLNLARPPRIVYLSTHGFASLPNKLQVDDPLLRCAIAFAGCNYVPDGGQTEALPGWMTGAEVLQANLRGTELVVLSACQTGTGEQLYGQSPADLRHAFHLAGARAVVSSLWSVPDRATRDLMTAFMQAPPGQDRAAALRAAQLKVIQEMRKSDVRHAHPFFWAAFTLSGS